MRSTLGYRSSPGYRPDRRLDTTGQRPYQIDGSAWLAQPGNKVLADAMRLGKTQQWLRSLAHLDRAWVICPSVARHVWWDECRRWCPDRVPLLGERLRRPSPRELLIVSYDSLPEPRWENRLIPEELHDTRGCFDEAHAIKSKEADRTVKCRLLRRQAGKVDGLTGSPVPGRADDLWGLLESCGATSSFESRKTFLEGAALADSDFKARLRRVMLRRTIADVAPHLPPIQRQTIPLDVAPWLSKELDELYARWNVVGGEVPPIGPGSHVRKLLAESRIEDAIRISRNVLAQGSALLVFSCHREPVLAMSRLPRSAVIVGDTPEDERARLIARFQSGRLDVLASTVDSGGVSVQLSRADVVLEIDGDWTPDVSEQAIARAVSLQKERPILAMRLTSPHPLERRLDELRAEKEALASRLLTP